MLVLFVYQLVFTCTFFILFSVNLQNYHLLKKSMNLQNCLYSFLQVTGLLTFICVNYLLFIFLVAIKLICFVWKFWILNFWLLEYMEHGWEFCQKYKTVGIRELLSIHKLENLLSLFFFGIFIGFLGLFLGIFLVWFTEGNLRFIMRFFSRVLDNLQGCFAGFWRCLELGLQWGF